MTNYGFNPGDRIVTAFDETRQATVLKVSPDGDVLILLFDGDRGETPERAEWCARVRPSPATASTTREEPDKG